jgi:C4-dicarboxylate-binding protein DctP
MLKKKKFFTILLAGFLIISLLSGCGANKSAEERTEEETIVLKWAHVAAISNDKHTDSAEIIAKEIEEATNGKVKIELYPASQLGNEREILEGIKLGTIEIGTLSSGALPGIFPEILAVSVPYLFPNREVAWKFFDGPMGKELADIMLEKNGLRILAWGENGLRCFTNNVRPIKRPEDLKGLKIRTMENPAHMGMVKTLGATPVPIPFSEVYTALAQETVDGQENPPSLVQSMRFYEVQKYMTLDYHVYDPLSFIMNEDKFKSLPEDIQKILEEKAVKWAQIERKMSEEQDKRDIEFMKEKGLQVIELTPEDYEAFRKVTAPVYDSIARRVGKDLMDKVIKAVEEAKK